jgi:enterochelin esterase-like enzyme
MARRSFLGLATTTLALGVTRSVRAEESVDVHDLTEGGRRFTLVVPKHIAAGEKVPLVILLHGLGETTDPRAGAFAWVERYGLVSSYERLRQRVPTLRGLVMACPYMPNVAGSSEALDAYGRWLTQVLVPRVRREAPVLEGDRKTTIGGCSLGGYVSLEVFLRRPESFGAWGGVQTAIGESSAARNAERLALAVATDGGAPRALSLVTSTEDPFRKANEALSRALVQRGVAHELRVLPGPHTQPWLRESGTLETLLFHARVT